MSGSIDRFEICLDFSIVDYLESNFLRTSTWFELICDCSKS